MTVDKLRLLETATHGEARRSDAASAINAGEESRLSPCALSAEADVGDDLLADWKTWRRYLLRRDRPKFVRRRVRGRRSSLRWNWCVGDAGRLSLLLKLLDGRDDARRANRKKLRNAAREWLAAGERHNGPIIATRSDVSMQNGSNGAPHLENGSAGGFSSLGSCKLRAAAALESLAWLHLLAERSDLFSGKMWREVWHKLRGIVDHPPPSADALAHQLAAAELPLAIACLFPELADGKALATAAAAAISHGMSELLDAGAVPYCRHLSMFPALAACWTRCRLIADQLDGSGWPPDAERRFPLILQAVVRLVRQDGGTPFGDEVDALARRSHRKWLAVAADLVADKPTQQFLKRARKDSRIQRGRSPDSSRLPKLALHSEQAELAVMRTGWGPRSERMTVAYADGIARIELAVGADIMLSGPWEWEVHADGAPLPSAGGWREVCWVSDPDCDYLELEMDFLGGARIQRHILLARDDKFLFLADAVVGSGPQTLKYRGRLSLSKNLSVSTAAETREVLLETQKAQALILPLGLPEWQAERHGGGMELNGGGLELCQVAAGPRLFAPVWIDLSRRRRRGAFTWRQLTVAEQRLNLNSDVAVGYRVQFGRRQWLIYRSLAPAANRTVLGQNLSSEFFLGRFDRNGETQTIVEIE